MALPLTLTLTLLTLALLALTLPSGIGQVAASVLQARRRLGEVPVRLDVGLCPGHRLAEPIERRTGARGVTLGEALRRVPQRRGRAAVRA